MLYALRCTRYAVREFKVYLRVSLRTDFERLLVSRRGDLDRLRESLRTLLSRPLDEERDRDRESRLSFRFCLLLVLMYNKLELTYLNISIIRNDRESM